MLELKYSLPVTQATTEDADAVRSNPGFAV